MPASSRSSSTSIHSRSSSASATAAPSPATEGSNAEVAAGLGAEDALPEIDGALALALDASPLDLGAAGALSAAEQAAPPRVVAGLRDKLAAWGMGAASEPERERASADPGPGYATEGAADVGGEDGEGWEEPDLGLDTGPADELRDSGLAPVSDAPPASAPCSVASDTGPESSPNSEGSSSSSSTVSSVLSSSSSGTPASDLSSSSSSTVSSVLSSSSSGTPALDLSSSSSSTLSSVLSSSSSGSSDSDVPLTRGPGAGAAPRALRQLGPRVRMDSDSDSSDAADSDYSASDADSSYASDSDDSVSHSSGSELAAAPSPIAAWLAAHGVASASAAPAHRPGHQRRKHGGRAARAVAPSPDAGPHWPLAATGHGFGHPDLTADADVGASAGFGDAAAVAELIGGPAAIAAARQQRGAAEARIRGARERAAAAGRDPSHYLDLRQGERERGAATFAMTRHLAGVPTTGLQAAGSTMTAAGSSAGPVLSTVAAPFAAAIGTGVSAREGRRSVNAAVAARRLHKARKGITDRKLRKVAKKMERRRAERAGRSAGLSLAAGAGAAGSAAVFAGGVGGTAAAAATPVGWVLVGVALSIGLPLGGYKLARWVHKRRQAKAHAAAATEAVFAIDAGDLEGRVGALLAEIGLGPADTAFLDLLEIAPGDLLAADVLRDKLRKRLGPGYDRLALAEYVVEALEAPGTRADAKRVLAGQGIRPEHYLMMLAVKDSDPAEYARQRGALIAMLLDKEKTC